MVCALQVQAWGIAGMAAAYRSIACSVAARMLALEDDKKLLVLLKAGAERHALHQRIARRPLDKIEIQTHSHLGGMPLVLLSSVRTQLTPRDDSSRSQCASGEPSRGSQRDNVVEKCWILSGCIRQ